MSRKSRTTLTVVEKLIEQRRLFQDWLAKLDEGVDGMPSHVVGRVRNDYRARLDGVMADLAEHRDGLREALEEAQERHENLGSQQRQKKDELAELRLRRHVGEMDEARFKEHSGALQSALEQVKREISAALRDIERYEEIIDVIASGDVPAAVGPAVEEPEGEERGEEDEELQRAAASTPPPPLPPPPAPTAVGVRPGPDKRVIEPKAPAEPEPEPATASTRQSEAVVARAERDPASAAPPAKAHVDELAFLRSVTSTVSAMKAPPPAARAAKPAAAGAPPARKEPARSEESGAVSIDAAPGLLELPAVEPEAAAPVAAAAAPPEPEATLVCKECGAVNRPTEWYCEKCGAELAAM